MRYASIDVLRAAAVGLMVLVHFLENLAGAAWAPAGLGAPLFAFLAGVSYRRWVAGQEARGRDDAEVGRVTVRRGLFLFALGVAFNVLVWMPEDVFNWDVLTMIGTALLVLNAMRNQPPAVPAVAAAGAFAVAPVLRAVADYHAYWPDWHFECDPTFADVLIGYLAAGYFPLFPWLAFPLAGFVAGTALFRPEPGERPPVGRAALAGLGLVGLSAGLRAWRLADPGSPAARLGGWTMFPASPEYVAGMLGVAVLALAAGRRWLDGRPRPRRPGGLLGAAALMSKYSLSMYLLHHVAHLWPLWLCGAAMGYEATHYWRRALPVEAALALVPVCLAAAYLLFRWADRTGRQGVEGWMRYLCD